LWRVSGIFASISDITALFLGTNLKKKQKLGGRLADALSELYLLSAVLKRYEDDGFPKEDYPIVKLCMIRGLSRFKESISGAIKNFPVKFIRPFLSVFILPFGLNLPSASDDLTHTVTR
jgi:acyl-CoA dehydrogenase